MQTYTRLSGGMNSSLSYRYVYDRKAEPCLGNIIVEFFTRTFHNAKTLANVASSGITLKLMSHDIDKNGNSGGAMSVSEAVGVC